MRASRRSVALMVLATAAIAIAVPLAAHEDMTKDRLVGTWQVISFTATAGSQVSYPQGEHPNGYVEFTQDRFWSLLIDSSRKAPATAAMTDAEAASLMRSHSAYTGKYEVDAAPTPDEIKVTVQVDAAANQAITGTNRVVYARVEGSKLTIRSPAIVVSTTGLKSVVQLEFVKVR